MELYLDAERSTRILVEEGNFTLQTLHTRKEGKNAGQPFWKLRGYFGSLDGALAASIYKMLVKGHDVTRVRALIGTIFKSQDRLAEASTDFTPAVEAHQFEGSVFGELRDNVWSKR